MADDDQTNEPEVTPRASPMTGQLWPRSTQEDTGGGGGGSGVPTTRVLTAGAGLTGGGDLTADRTFNVGAGSGITVTADQVAVDSSAVQMTSEKGAASGYASLDATGRVPAAQLPPSGGGGSGGGNGDRFLIATVGAPPDVIAAADLDLNTVANVATALQAALNANSRVLIWGPAIDLPPGSSVVVTSAVDILSFGTRITLPAVMPAPSSSRPAGLKIGGTRTQLTGWTLPATLSRGQYELVFSVNPSPALVAGDWLQIRTTVQNSPNRPAQYVKGEIAQVVNVSGGTVTLSVSLRDDYLVDGTLQLYRLNMLQGVVVEGLHVRAHPSATTQAEIWAIECCEAPVIRNCKVSGAAGYYGLGVFYSVHVLIDNLHATGVYDKFYQTGVGGKDGYGLHMSGVERVLIRGFRGDRCKHCIDLGQLSTSHPVPRHIVIEDGQFEHTYGSAFGTHNVQDIIIRNVTMRNCQGGIHVRGGDLTVDGYRFYGASTDIPDDVAAGGYGLDLGSGMFIGEEAGAELNRRGGPAGTRLTVKNCIIDAPWVGSGGSYNQNFRGIEIVDGLIDSYIEATISTSGDAFWADGDQIVRNTINLKVDRTQATSTRGGVVLVPGLPSGGTPTGAQQVSDNHITVTSMGGVTGGPAGAPGPAITIGGGQRGGTSAGNIIELTVPELAAGQTAATKQLVFASGGLFGTNYIQSLIVPKSNQATVVDAGSATLVYSDFTKYGFALQAYPSIVDKTSAFEVGTASPKVLTVACPNDYADGDYLLAVVISQGSDVSANPTLPTGFAQVGPTPTTSSMTMRYNAMFGKTVSGTQPSSFTFTFGTGSTANRMAVLMFLLRGGGSIASSGSGVATHSGVSPTVVSALSFAGISVAQPNSAVFAAAHATTTPGNAGTLVTPSGWTKVGEVIASIDPATSSTDTLTVFMRTASSAVSAFTAATDQTAFAANATFSVALFG